MLRTEEGVPAMPWARALGADIRTGVAERMDPAEAVDAGELHRRYLKEVSQYVSRRLPPQEAEDVAMQVFAAALEALPRFRGECPLRLWLLRIAHGKVVDALRRRSARRETLASELAGTASAADAIAEGLAASSEGPETALMRREASQAIRRLVDQLGHDQREALLQHYVEDLSIAEIAIL